MKTLLVLCMVLGAFSLGAQTVRAPSSQSTLKTTPARTLSTNAPPGTNATALASSTNTLAEAGAGSTVQAQAAALSAENAFVLQAPKANEIVSGKISYQGSLVEALKTGRPWQLFNPLAPARYGSPEDNVARDPINGRVIGLKFFAIRF
jgi:hypothetical protein